MLKMLIEVAGAVIFIPVYLSLSVVLMIGGVGLLCHVLEPGEWSLPKRIVTSVVLLALLPVGIVCIPGMIVASSLFSEEIVDKAEKIYYNRLR